ncbi:hypothetical protein KIL84_008546 [Mauremys mutica]|uniref:Uncharacterized protein n=1 Tax=Mauremys mutica TaxID=74926 RepID=A0A9D4AZI9_9SAUR|nr:hypothetical protein KIL84_008546 [Mauremys mutica]
MLLLSQRAARLSNKRLNPQRWSVSPTGTPQSGPGPGSAPVYTEVSGAALGDLRAEPDPVPEVRDGTCCPVPGLLLASFTASHENRLQSPHIATHLLPPPSVSSLQPHSTPTLHAPLLPSLPVQPPPVYVSRPFLQSIPSQKSHHINMPFVLSPPPNSVDRVCCDQKLPGAGTDCLCSAWRHGAQFSVGRLAPPKHNTATNVRGNPFVFVKHFVILSWNVLAGLNVTN